MPTQYLLPDLCDAYPEKVNVVAPQFNSYGGKQSYHGQIVTIKCHEDISLVAEQVDRNGDGKVLVVDGGGSLRCGLLGDNLAAKAVKNRWQGILVYGCIRDVDEIGEMDLGVHALHTHPLKSVKRGIGLLNEKVFFGSVTFSPGSYLYADNNGLLVSDELLAPV